MWQEKISLLFTGFSKPYVSLNDSSSQASALLSWDTKEVFNGEETFTRNMMRGWNEPGLFDLVGSSYIDYGGLAILVPDQVA